MEFNCKICQNCVESCCSCKRDELEYTPTFTKEEVEKIEDKFGSKNCLKPYNKNKTVFDIIAVQSKKDSNLFLCPFFDENIKKCKIYELRALDCKLFPFTFVNHNQEVYLAIVDGSVCSFIDKMDNKTLEELKKNMLEFIKKENVIETLKKYPDLILDDEDVILVEKIDLNKG